MMSFGWRPMMSCYVGNDKAGQATSTQQAVEAATAAAVCPSPTWFYTLLAIAAGLGIMKGGKR